MTACMYVYVCSLNEVTALGLTVEPHTSHRLTETPGPHEKLHLEALAREVQGTPKTMEVTAVALGYHTAAEASSRITWESPPRGLATAPEGAVQTSREGKRPAVLPSRGSCEPQSSAPGYPKSAIVALILSVIKSCLLDSTPAQHGK